MRPIVFSDDGKIYIILFAISHTFYFAKVVYIQSNPHS